MDDTSRQVRIIVVGDELAAGLGDAKALGWVGRVIARTPFETPPLVHTLAIANENTTDLSQRWEAEANRRFSTEPQADNRLVIGLGRHDLESGLSVARSRLNLANILDVAGDRRIPAFVVGPPPGDPADADRLAELSTAFADVASRRRVPYVDTFNPLVTHEQWLADLATSGELYPGQAGYGLITWLVLHTGWHAWLGLPDDVG